MSLSCTCDFDGDSDRYYETADDFSALDTKRSRKCCSCKTKVKPGDEVLKLRRYRDPSDRCNYIEESIYGDEVPLAPYYMCETCGGLYFAVQDLGMRCDIERDLKVQIREYNAMVKHFEAKG